LVALGVPGDKLRTISYGKERPVCTDQTEDCYQRNRHVHFAPAQ
jgi:peptidoglycan-associated lipoprotein